MGSLDYLLLLCIAFFFLCRCPSLSSGVCSNSSSLSWWWYLTISSSATLFSFLPSIFPSIRVFSSESAVHIRWPKYWRFSFSISPSNEYSWLISFRIDWFVLLAIQGTLKSLLQHHNSKASTLRHSEFFMVPLSHPYKCCFLGQMLICQLSWICKQTCYFFFNQNITCNSRVFFSPKSVKSSPIMPLNINFVLKTLQNFVVPLGLNSCLLTLQYS